jgi:hypothetical protein
MNLTFNTNGLELLLGQSMFDSQYMSEMTSSLYIDGMFPPTYSSRQTVSTATKKPHYHFRSYSQSSIRRYVFPSSS